MALLFSGVEPFMHFMKFEPGVQCKKLFKDISFLELRQPFSSQEQNHLCNFGRGYYEEQFCKIILNLDQWFRRIAF